MTIVALVPLRGGSKSIPKKNIKMIAGKPLCAWSLEAAIKSGIFDRIVVSTDSSEIAAVVRSIDPCVEILDRPAELATDEASTEAVMLHAANHYSFDILTTIQVTSPLVTAGDFTGALQKFESEELDSLLSATRVKHFYWTMDGPLTFDPFNRPRRQDYEGVLMENGAFYYTRCAVLEKYRCRLGDRIGIYEMSPDTAIDIDYPEDWELAEKKLRLKASSEFFQKIREVKLLAFDCDGVLTDGGMYYSENGDELKKFNTRDGHGLQMLREKGIKTALITAENSNAALARAEKLNIDEIFLGCRDKREPMRQLLVKYALNPEQAAYIGDDMGDIPAMEIAGISIAVKDAAAAVKSTADYILDSYGGQGAVREVCNFILDMS